MRIKIIGEEHDESPDVAFTEQAKAVAKSGRVTLVLENEIFDDYPDGLIERNIHAIEDKVIWEYSGIIRAISEIYFILKPYEELDNKNLLTMLREITEKDELYADIKRRVLPHLTDYAESYYQFLCNTGMTNPVSKILIKLLKKVEDSYGENNLFRKLFNFVRDRRGKKQYDVQEEEIELIKGNIVFFNKVLYWAAKFFREHIINGNYSPAIKNHPGISEGWLDTYFQFQIVRPEGKGHILNHDAVCVELRNQLFVERLEKLFRDNASDRDIWFIVGKAHLEGLKRLSSQRNLPVDIVEKEEKRQLLQLIEPVDIPTIPSAIASKLAEDNIGEGTVVAASANPSPSSTSTSTKPLTVLTPPQAKASAALSKIFNNPLSTKGQLPTDATGSSLPAPPCPSSQQP
jgi:hypothetical protein